MKKTMMLLFLCTGLIATQKGIHADLIHIEESLEKLRLTPKSNIDSLVDSLENLTLELRINTQKAPLTPRNTESITALAESTDIILTHLERMLETPPLHESTFSIVQQLEILCDLNTYWTILTTTNPEPLSPPSSRLFKLFPSIIKHIAQQLRLIKKSAQSSYGLLATITTQNDSPFSFPNIQKDLSAIVAAPTTEAIDSFNKSFYGKGFHAYITPQLREIEALFKKHYNLQQQLLTLSEQLHKAAIRINSEHPIFNVLTARLIRIDGSLNNLKSFVQAAVSENNRNFAPYAIYILLEKAFNELKDTLDDCKKGQIDIAKFFP